LGRTGQDKSVKILFTKKALQTRMIDLEALCTVAMPPQDVNVFVRGHPSLVLSFFEKKKKRKQTKICVKQQITSLFGF
jgi:hypothetical protein